MWLTNRRPSVLLWRCLLCHLTRKIVSEIAYNVSRGTLNSTIPYHLEGLRLVSAISARELIGHGSLWLFVYLRFRSTLTYLFTYFYPPLGTLGIRDSASGPSWKFLPHSSQAPPLIYSVLTLPPPNSIYPPVVAAERMPTLPLSLTDKRDHTPYKIVIISGRASGDDNGFSATDKACPIMLAAQTEASAVAHRRAINVRLYDICWHNILLMLKQENLQCEAQQEYSPP